jgi:hypothetical protein
MPSDILCYAVLHNNHYTLLLENINLYFVLQQAFFIRSFVSFFIFFLHFTPYSISSFLNVTVLRYNVFTKTVYNQTSNWILVR